MLSIELSGEHVAEEIVDLINVEISKRALSLPAMYCYSYPRPSVAVDLLCFAKQGNILSILLVKRGKEPFSGSWALPGGFLNMDETGDQAAKRECLEETGFLPLGDPEIIYVADAVDRDPRGRVIGLAYAMLVDGTPEVTGSDDAAEAAWFNLLDLPASLAFDHNEIVVEGLLWLSLRGYDTLIEDSSYV